MGRCSGLLAALCLVDTVTPWAPRAAQRWARRSARRATQQDIDAARSADIVAVAESFAPSVLAALPVKVREGGGLLVDATEFFVRDATNAARLSE